MIATQGVHPTRAVFVAASRADIASVCAKKSLTFTAMEDLPSGGTRVVLTTLDEAESVRHAFRKKLLAGDSKRAPLWSQARRA